MTATMKIKCVAPWAGGKRRLAKRIVDLLGPHDTYVEPFVGGCSILPAKPRADREYVYDLNPDVIAVLNEMRCYPASLAGRLSVHHFSRAQFDGAMDRLSMPDSELPVGRRPLDLLIKWWMGPGGIAGTNRKPWFAQRHTKTGGCPERRWKSFVESVPALCERLRGVVVNVADGITAVEHGKWWMDDPDTAIYVDPPYFSKSFKYALDFSDADHARLATAMNRIVRARVVVSYTDDPADPDRLATMYPPARWRRIEVEQSKNMSATNGKTGRAVEVLLVNDA